MKKQGPQLEFDFRKNIFMMVLSLEFDQTVPYYLHWPLQESHQIFGEFDQRILPLKAVLD